jgi:hypothetical protein
MKKLLFFLLIVTSLGSCKKSESNFNQVRNSIDSLLKDNPDFQVISNECKGELQYPKFTSYKDAKIYMDSLNKMFRNNVRLNSTKLINRSLNVNNISLSSVNKKYVPLFYNPDLCTSPGEYYSSFGKMGILSNYNAYITIGSSGISSVSFFVTGVAVGWGWNQISNYSNGYSGCTGGTINWGIEIGSVLLGTSANYHFSYTLNPNTCIMTVSHGYGPC